VKSVPSGFSQRTVAPYHHGETNAMSEEMEVKLRRSVPSSSLIQDSSSLSPWRQRAMSAEKEASLEENAKTASCFLWSLLGEELTLVFKSRNLDL